ncbi:MAG TPA: hypothetical protein VGF95_12425 [Solirubrobacteraceae bacterium]
MLRRLSVLTASLVIAVAAAVALLPVAAADAFNPATQSHPGACSQETESVTHAVHDYAENGVLDAFAGLVGIHGSTAAVMHRMDSELVLGAVVKRVVTENHGCEGVGEWFSVGPRTLNVGEPVGVRVPAKLRTRLCAHARSGCKRVAFDAHVVFPINCWNPNFGSVRVALYVHKPKVVPKSYKKRHLPKREVAPAQEAELTPTPATPIATPSAVPAPSATERLDCSAGAVVVTLSNAASATGSASFTVDGKSYGPLAAGASETVTVPLAPGESTMLEVVSGGSVLVASRQIVNTCSADPEASIEATCIEEDGELDYSAEVVVHLVNAPGATLPASFTVEWEAEYFNEENEGLELVPISEAVGPLAPGGEKTIEFVIEEAYGQPTHVSVSSGGRKILEEELTLQCGEPE